MTCLMFPLTDSSIAGGVKPSQQMQHTSHRARRRRGELCSGLGLFAVSDLQRYHPSLLLCHVLLACLLVTETQ